MKKLTSIAIMIALVMIFSGCGAENKAAESSKDKEVLAQLNVMKEQKNKPKEMFDYLNQNIKELPKPAATEALGVLLNTMEEYETIYNDQIFEGSNPDLMIQYFQSGFDYSKIEYIKEQALKDLLLDITLGGYKIVDVEGSFAVMMDYDSLKTFNEYVEDEIKTYIEIMALRYSDPVAIDASLQIEAGELEARILQMENYILTYTNEQRKEIMLSMYEGHIMVYMGGIDNSPIFDYETGAMNVEMFKTFETAAAKNKDTVFSKTLSKYVQLLKEESYTNTEKVQDFIINIDSVIVDQLSRVEKK